jgi:putative nucleotidyltransferase with HDIG domain
MDHITMTPVRDAVRTFNKYILNPAMLHLAGRQHWYAAVIPHTGRNSGRNYATPVVADRVGDGVILPLPYGTRVDWLRNVLVDGRATIEAGGQTYAVVEPEIIDSETAASQLSPTRLWAVRHRQVRQAEAGADRGLGCHAIQNASDRSTAHSASLRRCMWTRRATPQMPWSGLSRRGSTSRKHRETQHIYEGTMGISTERRIGASRSTARKVEGPMSEQLIPAARDLIGRVLREDPERLHHCAAVAAKAEALAATVPPSAADTLIAAAWLHDIGYASLLRDSGFHPLDGAEYLRQEGWPKPVCDLVAHHSGSRFVARVRGLDERLREFAFVEDAVSDALTVADNTAGPDGIVMDLDERLREKRKRHGPDSPNARANPERDDYIRSAARRVADRLAAVQQRDPGLNGVDEQCG